ncbi:MAG: protein TolR [Pseudomonadota bacterium]
MTGFRRQRKKRKLNADINVVPYIDVMLVLLVIFMVTAPMITQGVKVELPEVADAEMSQEQEKPIIVSISQSGALSYSRGEESQENMTQGELISRVQQAVSATPKLNVMLHGDRGINYERVVTIMAALQQAGVTGVGLVTQPLKQ